MKIQRPSFLAAAALAAMAASCAPHARVGVYADVPGPPALSFQSDPYFVPLPGTYAYAVPDYDIDLYYSDGYYWRPWQGRWYRSSSYDRGWVAFSGVPRFYTSLPRNWRDDYRSHRWRGRSWDYARVPRHEVERNWSTWKRERRWDDDQRRYTGDRRWHDNDRHTDGRDRDGDRRTWDQGAQDRRDPDLRRSDDDRREPDRREADRRVYESREIQRQPVERREVEQRRVESRDVERREVERREVERRGTPPGRSETKPRPVVVEERRTIERQQVAPDGRGQGQGRGQDKGRDVTPRGRGPVGKDENRDGIDDSLQRAR